MDIVQLVKRSQSGDRDAFGLLYNLYAPSMMKVIETCVHNHDIAQDILHDGFIIAFSALDKLIEPIKFESWLTTIMRNLSLQYLREASNHITVPMTDTSGESLYEDSTVDNALLWDELSNIIDKLPDGYSKVFRLAVLDGLSHKEIGEILGIAPHSSSSQLSHAKAMLRRLITEYRVGMGIIVLFAVIFSVIMIWLGINRKNEKVDTNLIANESDNGVNSKINETKVAPQKLVKDTTVSPTKVIYRKHEIDILAEISLPADTVPEIPDNNIHEDTIPNIPKTPIVKDNELLADNNVSIRHNEGNNWSLSLAYSGNMGQNTDSHYRMPIDPDPDLPSGTPEEIDVTEKSRHYMPLTIGLSLNYGLSSRWCVESGIRYTFLRSDFMCESEIEKTEINQRIHYIGIPLKFNYRISGNNRFSIYGQGGAALDIPVNGTQSIMKWEQGWNKPEFDRITISAPMQWSIEGGVGLQYHLTPSISIYAEPSFRYYFNPGTDIKTIRQDKPFEFTIPIGIRLNW